MRNRFAERKVLDLSSSPRQYIPVISQGVAEDAIYDPISTRTAHGDSHANLNVGYQCCRLFTWFDCCGFGFRHILVERDFTRSFAVQRKIETMKKEVNQTWL